MSFFFSSSKKSEPILEVTNVMDENKAEPEKGEAAVKEEAPVKEQAQEEENKEEEKKETPTLSLSIDDDDDDDALLSAFDKALNKEPESGATLASPTSKVGLNYDESPTSLYQSIEAKEWDDVEDLCQRKPIEASIWIFRNEKTGHKLRWRLLPIHAAIIFRAPDAVIRSLLKAYPEGVRSKDDQDMTPLHLAFRHESSDSVLYELLKTDPTVVQTVDRKGRSPLDLHRSTTAQGGKVTKKSGIAKLVAIAVENENKKVSAALRHQFQTSLTISEQNHASQLQETVQYYEDAITALRKEMTDKIESMNQSAGMSKTDAEKKIKELEEDVKTARLASESLITRFDAKCKSEEELKEKLAAAKKHLQELEWGQGDTLKEKEEISHQKLAIEMELEEVKEAREKIVQELRKVESEKQGLENTFTLVQAELAQLGGENEVLSQRNSELSTFVEERQSVIQDLKARIGLMEESIATKAEQITYLQSHNDSLQEQRDNLTEAVEALVGDLKAKKQRLKELEEVECINQGYTDELLDVKAKLKAKQDNLEELNSAEWHMKVNSMTDQVAKLQIENEQMRSEVEEARIVLKKYEREVADAKNASNSLIKQFQAKCNSEVQLKAKLAALEKSVVGPSFQSDNISLRQSVQVLEKANSELGDKVQAMEAELSEKTNMVEKFEEEWKQRTAEVREKEATQSNELSRGKEKVQILERIISKLQEKIASLQESNKKMMSAEGTDAYSKEKIEELSKEVESKTALNAELTERLHMLERKNAEMSKNFEESQAEHQAFLESMKKKETQTNGSLDVRQRMTDALEMQLAASHEMNQELQTKIKTLEAKNSTLMMRAKSMTPERRPPTSGDYSYDRSPYRMPPVDYSQRMHYPSEPRDGVELNVNTDDNMSQSSSMAMRQRMKLNVERQVKEAQDKAATERRVLLENARKQRQDIESSFASATAAINMLRETGMRP